MLSNTLRRVHSSISSLNTFIFLWWKRVIVSKSGAMKAINSLMSIEVRFAASIKKLFGLWNHRWGMVVLLCSFYRCRHKSSESFHDLSEPRSWWVAELRYKPRPPDSSTCFISHKASVVHLSLEASLTSSCNCRSLRANEAGPLESLNLVLRIRVIYPVWALCPKSSLLKDGPWTSNIISSLGLAEVQNLRPLKQKCMIISFPSCSLAQPCLSSSD